VTDDKNLFGSCICEQLFSKTNVLKTRREIRSTVSDQRAVFMFNISKYIQILTF